MNSFFHIYQYRHLIVHKAWADFRAESQRTYLGVGWWIVDPIISTFIYYLVFGVFFDRGGEDFVPYLVTGIIGWNWFMASVIAASVSIWNNATMVRQVSFNKIIFPCSQILVCTYKFAFSMLVLFGALFLYGYYPDPYWLLAIVPMLVGFMLISACGLILGAIVPFFPDLASFVPYVLRLGFYMSCVMFKLEELASRFQTIIKLNPMVHILNAYRDVIMNHQVPALQPLFILMLISIVIWFLGRVFFKRIEREIRDFL